MPYSFELPKGDKLNNIPLSSFSMWHQPASQKKKLKLSSNIVNYLFTYIDLAQKVTIFTKLSFNHSTILAHLFSLFNIYIEIVLYIML